MTKPYNAQYDNWRDAVTRADTFRFAKITGDRDLLSRLWSKLKEKGSDPLSTDMLAIKDLEIAINQLIDKAAKYDQFELILNDTTISDRITIERLASAFYD